MFGALIIEHAFGSVFCTSFFFFGCLLGPTNKIMKDCHTADKLEKPNKNQKEHHNCTELMEPPLFTVGCVASSKSPGPRGFSPCALWTWAVNHVQAWQIKSLGGPLAESRDPRKKATWRCTN